MRRGRNCDHRGGCRHWKRNLRRNRRPNPPNSIHAGTCQGSVNRSQLILCLEQSKHNLRLGFLCALCELCVEIFSFSLTAAIPYKPRRQPSKSRFAESVPKTDIVKEESLRRS